MRSVSGTGNRKMNVGGLAGVSQGPRCTPGESAGAQVFHSRWREEPGRWWGRWWGRRWQRKAWLAMLCTKWCSVLEPTLEGEPCSPPPKDLGALGQRQSPQGPHLRAARTSVLGTNPRSPWGGELFLPATFPRRAQSFPGLVPHLPRTRAILGCGSAPTHFSLELGHWRLFLL